MNRFKTAIIALVILAAGFASYRLLRPPQPADTRSTRPPALDRSPKITLAPQRIKIQDSPLKQSAIEAGDYLVRQQLPNGELSYAVDILSGRRTSSPSALRLMAGTGSLYTVCRAAQDIKYCQAGDLALNHYLNDLVSDPEHFEGTCLYSDGGCQLGGAALTVDAIYKRWQATGSIFLNDRDLLDTAVELGYFIVSMRKPEGGFYHSFDPHDQGTVDPDYFVIYYPGESLLALLELHDMTGNEFWLQQAREVNAYMLTQTVTEDHWHSYAFAHFADADGLQKDDLAYAKQIAELVIAGQIRSLNPANSSISTATKLESLAALAKAFYLAGAEHAWLEPDIRTFITFVRARQLPDNNCGWDANDTLAKFAGGIFSDCEDPSVRIDGLQHYINGVVTYLEYLSLIQK